MEFTEEILKSHEELDGPTEMIPRSDDKFIFPIFHVKRTQILS